MKNRAILSLVIGFIMIFSLSFNIYADESDLNGVGIKETTEVKETKEVEKQDTQEQQKTQEGLNLPKLPATEDKTKDKSKKAADAIGDLFSNVGPDAESINEANEFLRPFAVIMNKLMAIVLGVTSIAMMFITVLDLLYMAFPPVRDLLDGGMAGGMAGGQQMQGGRNRGMYGMRGQMGMSGGAMMGSGMGMDGGMGMGSMPSGRQQQAPGGGLSALGRWVSDEAMAACSETQGGVMNGGQPGPIKSMLFSYMKKRSMFIILFGVCVILFTSTAFTDLGIKIGTWLLSIILGIGN